MTEYIEVANEFCPIPNDLVDQLARVMLKPHDYRVLLLILRKTLGWAKKGANPQHRKKMDALALSQFSNGTGLDRRRVHEALARLEKRRIILVRPSTDRKPKSYGINFTLSEWSLSTPVRTERRVRNVLDSLSGWGRTAVSTPVRTSLSTPSAHTKETLKENKKKGKESARPESLEGDSVDAAQLQRYAKKLGIKPTHVGLPEEEAVVKGA